MIRSDMWVFLAFVLAGCDPVDVARPADDPPQPMAVAAEGEANERPKVVMTADSLRNLGLAADDGRVPGWRRTGRTGPLSYRRATPCTS